MLVGEADAQQPRPCRLPVRHPDDRPGGKPGGGTTSEAPELALRSLRGAARARRLLSHHRPPEPMSPAASATQRHVHYLELHHPGSPGSLLSHSLGLSPRETSWEKTW